LGSDGYYPVILYPPLVKQFCAVKSRLEQYPKALLRDIVKLPLTPCKVQQGVSENTFLRYLLSYFANQIVCQSVPLEIYGSNRYYWADFILYDRHFGLALDIEIDEPYVGNTGKPHHCLDFHKDIIRNRFFLQRNWVIIRFAEIQVVKYPLSCCKTIAQTIAKITGDKRNLMILDSLPDLPLQKRWTNKEARQMAKNNYRQFYLSIAK
jgi:hypothetical protein